MGVRETGARPREVGDRTKLRGRMGRAWAKFIDKVRQGDWVQTREQRGAQAALHAYGHMLGGRIPARQALLLDMRG